VNVNVTGEESLIAANARNRTISQLEEHTCPPTNEPGKQSITAFVDVLQEDGNIWNDTCFIGYECFDACPDAILAAPTSTQPSSYRMVDRIEERSTGTDYCLRLINRETGIGEDSRTEENLFFSCEDMQATIRYDVAALDGRLQPFTVDAYDQAQIAFANVDIKGTVRQVLTLVDGEPVEVCNDTLMFVEGTLVGGLAIDPSGRAIPQQTGEPLNLPFLPVIEDLQQSKTRSQASVPELLLTSSFSLNQMDYTILSAPTDETDDRCFSPSTRLTYRRGGRTPRFPCVPRLLVQQDFTSTNIAVTASHGMTELDNGLPGQQYDTILYAVLPTVCDNRQEGVPLGVQIQCRPTTPINVTADDPPLEAGVDFDLKSIANVATDSSTAGLSDDNLQSDFLLSCTSEDVERIRNRPSLAGGASAFIVRTIPLFVDVPAANGEPGRRVNQLCPVLTFCRP